MPWPATSSGDTSAERRQHSARTTQEQRATSSGAKEVPVRSVAPTGQNHVNADQKTHLRQYVNVNVGADAVALFRSAQRGRNPHHDETASLLVDRTLDRPDLVHDRKGELHE